VKVNWIDVREDYARKDAEIKQLTELKETQEQRIKMLIGLLSVQDLKYYEDAINR
jgi:hypothetical protein|tara:strand:- start:3035 stop:3199 length:165 start_codon:yes stop_codon:yes gene_type:complete